MKRNTMQNRIQENVLDAVENNFSDVQQNVSHFVDMAKPYAETAVKKSKELYNEAISHIPENSRKIVGFTAAGLAIGVVGYQIGKARKKPQLLKEAAQASSNVTQQFSPVFKFLKLWMLYRLAI